METLRRKTYFEDGLVVNGAAVNPNDLAGIRIAYIIRMIVPKSRDCLLVDDEIVAFRGE